MLAARVTPDSVLCAICEREEALPTRRRIFRYVKPKSWLCHELIPTLRLWPGPLPLCQRPIQPSLPLPAKVLVPVG